MKRTIFTGLSVLLLVFLLTGCSVRKGISLLYGGDAAQESKNTPSYKEYEGDNGIAVVYDETVWEEPSMVEENVLGVVSGNRISYTAVLLQTTDKYEDFLRQSGEELKAENPAVEYDWDLSVPNASVKSVRYDCGSYQTMFAEVTYDSGLTVYVSAATHSGNTEPIVQLLQNVYPIGARPESASQLIDQSRTG